MPPADRLPKAWTDKLASIQLPDVPVSNPNNGYPTYSNGQGSDPKICSFTYECTTDDDLHVPPDGIWAVSPLPMLQQSEFQTIQLNRGLGCYREEYR